MKKNPLVYGESVLIMYPSLRFSSINLSSCLSSSGDMGYTLQFSAANASGFRTMWWSCAPCCSIWCDSFSKKMKACWWYSFGTISSQDHSFLSVATSANCWATVVLAILSMSPLWVPLRVTAPYSFLDCQLIWGLTASKKRYPSRISLQSTSATKNSYFYL